MMRRKLNFGHETMISPLGIPFKKSPEIISFKMYTLIPHFDEDGIRIEFWHNLANLVVLKENDLVTLCYLYFQKLEWRGVIYLFNVNKQARF